MFGFYLASLYHYPISQARNTATVCMKMRQMGAFATTSSLFL